MSGIFSIGVFISYFMALLFFTKKDKNTSDFIIGIWMLIVGTHFLAYFIYYLGMWDKHPFLFGTTALFPLLHAPFLYLYVTYSISGSKKFKLQNLLYFIPAIITYPHIFHIMFTYSAEQKRMLDSGVIDDSSFITFVLLLLLASATFFITLSFKSIKKHQQNLESNYSYTEKVDLKWLQYWIYGITGVFCLVALITFLRDIMSTKLISSNADLVFYVLFILLIIVLGYFGISQHGIFSTESDSKSKKAKDSSTGFAIKDEELIRIQNELPKIMEGEKPYLNPKLTLTELANLVDTTPNILSQILNQNFKMKFYHFINGYRVEEFKRRAEEKPNYSILALAFESGFNSKSSFNSIFKRETGITPLEFLKSIPLSPSLPK